MAPNAVPPAPPTRPRARRAERQRLIAQAVAVFQQDQPALIDIVGGNARGLRARIVRRHRQQEQIVEQGERFDVGLADRQRQHRGIERAALDLLDQLPGLRLAQFEPQVREAALQQRQNPRQHIGRERRNHAERQPPGQQAAAMAREIDEIARGREHVLAAAGDLAADFGQHHLARPPLDHGDAERALEIADLHRQRRLGDGAGLGGPAEMAVLGQRGEIAKLSKRDHSAIR